MRPVTVSGLSLSGADAGNYVLSVPLLGADITPAPLLVTGVTANGKIYDATTAITLSGSPGITPLGDDAVSLAGTLSGALVDKNAGTARPVLLSGLTITGADASNYTLQLSSSVTADVQPYGFEPPGSIGEGGDELAGIGHQEPVVLEVGHSNDHLTHSCGNRVSCCRLEGFP